MKTVLKSLVGSRAHDLHTEESDYDYRGVHLLPTSNLLGLGSKNSPTCWLEGGVDETSYEISHFLHLCTKANPSALEVLLADQIKEETDYAKEMRDLFPLMYNPDDAFNAFVGYSKNQQKKMLEDHLARRLKYGVAYLRTAYNLVSLFQTGTFSLRVEGEKKSTLIDMKQGKFSDGKIIDLAEEQISIARELLPRVENRQDLTKINDFLLKVRKENW